MSDLITTLLANFGTLLLSFVGLFFLYNEKKKAANLANVTVEIQNAITVIDMLKEERERMDKELEKKDTLIQKLYLDNDDFREQNNSLKTQNAILNYTKCTDNNCTKRIPPRVIDGQTNKIII